MDDILIYFIMGIIVVGAVYFALLNERLPESTRDLVQTICLCSGIVLGAIALSLLFASSLFTAVLEMEAGLRQSNMGF